MARKRTSRDIREEMRKLAASADPRTRAELLHEVQVFQEELLTQNEELRRAQYELEVARDQFIEL